MLSFISRSAGITSLDHVVPQACALLALQRNGSLQDVSWFPVELDNVHDASCSLRSNRPASAPSTSPSYAGLPSPSLASACSTAPTHSSHHPLGHPLQHQQFRSYRIPYRTILPKVPYSERSGRSAPRPLPEFEAVKGGTHPEELRWHRSVVRFPPEVAVSLETAEGGARTLALSGRAGTIRLSLQELDPTGLLALRLLALPATGAEPTAAGKAAPAAAKAAAAGGQRSLLILASPDKARFEAVGAELNKAIRGVMTGYLLGLTVKGVGYRVEPLVEGENIRRPPPLNAAQLLRRSRDPNGNSGVPKPYYFEMPGTAAEQQAQSNIAFPFNKPAAAVRLKVGYSRAAVYPLPPHVRAFFLKPTLMYLYGIELDELRRVAAEIRSIRKPNPYTGNGVQYLDEVVKLKQRAGAK